MKYKVIAKYRYKNQVFTIIWYVDDIFRIKYLLDSANKLISFKFI